MALHMTMPGFVRVGIFGVSCEVDGSLSCLTGRFFEVGVVPGFAGVVFTGKVSILPYTGSR
jgi:hypothetical protein